MPARTAIPRDRSRTPLALRAALLALVAAGCGGHLDPSSLKVVAMVPRSLGLPQDTPAGPIAVHEGFAYMTTGLAVTAMGVAGGGVDIVKVGSGADAAVVRHVAVGAAGSGAGVILGVAASALFVLKDSQILSIDIHDPANAVANPTPITGFGLAVPFFIGTTAYTCDAAYDVSDPLRWKELGSAGVSGFNPTFAASCPHFGTTTYGAAGATLHVIDLSHPAAPKELGATTLDFGGTYPVLIPVGDGTLLSPSSDRSKLVIDARDPAHASFVAGEDFQPLGGPSASDIYPTLKGSTLVTAEPGNATPETATPGPKLIFTDVSSPRRPTNLGSMHLPGVYGVGGATSGIFATASDDAFIYVSTTRGLVIIR